MQTKEELSGLVDRRDEISKKIKERFEASLMRDDVVEYYLSKSKAEIEDMFRKRSS